MDRDPKDSFGDIVPAAALELPSAVSETLTASGDFGDTDTHTGMDTGGQHFFGVEKRD